ncbi:MAG: hypothetical protein BA873_00315 [Desulfobulbaceae bacterium C00003063]|nr:MAG: hypothetical protein BA873_00315 [Desulfobulbaceae bacterium C00003063]
MMQFYHNNRAILQVLVGAFMISFSAVWVRAADVPPATSGLYRVFFGFLILFLVSFWRKEMRTVGVKKLLLIIFCGFIFALDLLFWHESILFIGPGLATILSNFQAFILAAIGILFFGEKIRPQFLFSIPVAILGLFFVVGTNWHLSPNYKTGIFLGLLTAICYAGFLISLQKIQREENHSSFFFTLMLISFVCTIFLALKMVLYGDPFIIPDTQNLYILLSLAFFSQVLGWILIANSMPWIRTSLTGFILLLQPALSFIWDVLFFSRPTDLTNWLGVIVTLTAIYMGVTGNLKNSD